MPHTRRRLLVTAAVTTGVALVGEGEVAAHQKVVEPWVTGLLVEVARPSVIVRTLEGDVAVALREDATFSRDGDTRLEAFIPGDHVALWLTSSDPPPIAQRMVTRYQMITGTVVEKADTWIRCTGGTVALDSTTTAHWAGSRYPKIRLSEILVGHYVGVTSRFEPAANGYYAREIAVYTET